MEADGQTLCLTTTRRHSRTDSTRTTRREVDHEPARSGRVVWGGTNVDEGDGWDGFLPWDDWVGWDAWRRGSASAQNRSKLSSPSLLGRGTTSHLAPRNSSLVPASGGIPIATQRSLRFGAIAARCGDRALPGPEGLQRRPAAMTARVPKGN